MYEIVEYTDENLVGNSHRLCSTKEIVEQRIKAFRELGDGARSSDIFKSNFLTSDGFIPHPDGKRIKIVNDSHYLKEDFSEHYEKGLGLVNLLFKNTLPKEFPALGISDLREGIESMTTRSMMNKKYQTIQGLEVTNLNQRFGADFSRCLDFEELGNNIFWSHIVGDSLANEYGEILHKLTKRNIGAMVYLYDGPIKTHNHPYLAMTAIRLLGIDKGEAYNSEIGTWEVNSDLSFENPIESDGNSHLLLRK